MPDTRYNPPVKVGQREISYASLVNRADQDNARLHVWDREYPGEGYDSGGFGGRGKYRSSNPTKRGAYADD